MKSDKPVRRAQSPVPTSGTRQGDRPGRSSLGRQQPRALLLKNKLLGLWGQRDPHAAGSKVAETQALSILTSLSRSGERF